MKMHMPGVTAGFHPGRLAALSWLVLILSFQGASVPLGAVCVSEIDTGLFGDATGMDYADGLLWVSDHKLAPNVIYQFDPCTGALVGTLPSPVATDFNARDLVVVGEQVFQPEDQHGDHRIHRFAKTDGAVLEVFAHSGTFPTGIASDGAFLWVVDIEGGGLQKRLLSSPDYPLVESFPLPNPAAASRGMTYFAGALWLVHTDTISRIDPDSGMVVETLAVPEPVASALLAPDAFLRDIAFGGPWTFFLVPDAVLGDRILRAPAGWAGLGPGGEISFASRRTGNWEIWTMYEDGSGQSQVTDFGRMSIHPKWSPDSTKIAFMSGVESGVEFDLYVMDSDGSNVIQLATHAEVGNRRLQNLSWSPDGEQIVFAAAIGCCSGGVWVVDTDGSNLTNLYTGTFVGSAELSADGEQIVFNPRANPLSFSHQLWVMEADGSNAHPIVADCCSEGTAHADPDWGPHPSRILSSFGHNIWIFDSDGTNRQQLTTGGSWPPSPYLYSEPGWSPDLDRVVFRRVEGSISEIFVMNSDGTNVVQLTDGGYNAYPDWRLPTGCTVAAEDDGLDDWTLAGVGSANQQSVEIVDDDGNLELALTADGSTAYYGADNAGFLFQELTGDFRLETTIDSTTMTTGKAWRKAGLMARVSLDPWDVRLLATLVPVQERLQFVARATYGSPGNIKLASELEGAPSVVRLAIERTGQVLSVQYSLDGGTTWITPSTSLGGSLQIPDLPETLLVGLAMVSNDISVTSTALFDDLTLCR